MQPQLIAAKGKDNSTSDDKNNKEKLEQLVNHIQNDDIKAVQTWLEKNTHHVCTIDK